MDLNMILVMIEALVLVYDPSRRRAGVLIFWVFGTLSPKPLSA